MYSEKLEEVIAAAIADGNLTEQKCNIIKRRAEKEGEDIEEVMMVVESRLKNVSKTPAKNIKATKSSVSKTVKEENSSKSFVEAVNGVSFKMTKVEGGTFTMFNNIGYIKFCQEHSFPYAKPQKVILDDFFIGETVVTQELWKAVMGEKTVSFHFVGDKLPVNNVNPKDVYDFIKKLNKLTNRNYHLPSEAQWEYAAIGGRYSLGYEFAGSNDQARVAWYADNTKTYTDQDMMDFYNSKHFFKAKETTFKVTRYFFDKYDKDLNEVKPVALLRPNELGLYDMSGNVDELCEDDYDDDPILNNKKNPIYKDPCTNIMVIRGGNCSGRSDVLLRCCANKEFRSDSTKYLGFRIVL